MEWLKRTHRERERETLAEGPVVSMTDFLMGRATRFESARVMRGQFDDSKSVVITTNF